MTPLVTLAVALSRRRHPSPAVRVSLHWLRSHPSPSVSGFALNYRALFAPDSGFTLEFHV